MIKTYEDFLFHLQEGLLNTYDINFSVKRVRTLLGWYKIKKCQIVINEESNDFQLYIDEKINSDFIESLHKLLVSFGYFISIIIYNKNEKLIYNLDDALKLDFDNITDYYFQIERHFDKKIKYNGILFHVTLKNKLEKIKSIGLCPKSGQKTLAHPSRIYLSYNRSQVDEMLKLLHNYKKEEYAIIQLRVENLEIYNDPNSTGCYTLDNIKIENITTIYDENWNVIK